MVSIAELLQWKPETLGEVADTLVRKRLKLMQLQDEIDGGEPPSTWVAGSAGGAHTTHGRLRDRLNDLVAEVSDVAVNLDDAQVRITTAKQSLEEAMLVAQTKGFTVNRTTGRVEDPREDLDPTEAYTSRMDVSAVAADIDAALQAAGEADLDLAAALNSAVKGETDGGTGSLADAAVQTTERMDQMSDEELAEMLGGDVALHTISAYLEAELELATWELEGKAEAEYTVMADGTVKMKLALEAGLGREISVGGGSADVSGGGTTELELTFDSPEEAQEFLDGLDDAAFDLGWRDGFNAPAAVATNVAEYVMEQDVSSFKTGIYGQGEFEFETPLARGALEGRVDAYYDWAEEKYGLKIGVSGEADVGQVDEGQQGTGYGVAAGLEGELTITKDGDFDALKLRGELDATAANENLGITAPPGSSSGMGVDVELLIDKNNPHYDEIEGALTDGDIDRAKDLAFQYGEMTARTTVTESIASDEIEIDAGPVGGVEVNYGADAETATQIWHREPGRSEVVEIDPTRLPAYTGR
ncbi:hypothetical protein [Nocardioides marmoraquaticus]